MLGVVIVGLWIAAAFWLMFRYLNRKPVAAIEWLDVRRDLKTGEILSLVLLALTIGYFWGNGQLMDILASAGAGE